VPLGHGTREPPKRGRLAQALALWYDRHFALTSRDEGPLKTMLQRRSSEAFLRFIIVEKAFIGVLVFTLSIGVLGLINKDVVVIGRQIAATLNLDTDNAYITLALEKLGLVNNKIIVGLSMGGFAYALLNLAEAYGLHRRLRWAEWLTVAATGLLIPFELYEVWHRFTPDRVGVLLLNVAIVIYLAKHKELFPRWF